MKEIQNNYNNEKSKLDKATSDVRYKGKSNTLSIRHYKEFLSLLEYHGYNLESNYKNASTKVTISKEGKTISVTPSYFKSRNGDVGRGGEYQADISRRAKERFLNSLPSTGFTLKGNYINTVTPTEFICENGHSYIAPPESIKKGTICPTCAGQCTESVFKKLVAEAGHKIDYNIGYNGSYQHHLSGIDMICNKGHSYRITPYAFQKGKRCPHCKKIEAVNKKKDKLKKTVSTYSRFELQTHWSRW
ncbi:hypothetical protein QNZ53_000438 [Vibrio parahaemolyticus]|nr:hypothetical protein [Vibrio parahaemolyticus]